MNIDELQKLWNEAGNQPTPSGRARAMNQFTATLRRRRRQEFAWILWTFFVLTVVTGFATWLAFGTNKVNLAAEWAVIPLLLIPWLFAGLFLRRFLQVPVSIHRGDVPITESLGAAMAANKAERLKLKTIGIMYLVALPVLAFSIWQLYAVGKVSSRELGSMITFLGSALFLSAAAVFARYRFWVAPEGEKLTRLFSQFEQ